MKFFRCRCAVIPSLFVLAYFGVGRLSALPTVGNGVQVSDADAAENDPDADPADGLDDDGGTLTTPNLGATGATIDTSAGSLSLGATMTFNTGGLIKSGGSQPVTWTKSKRASKLTASAGDLKVTTRDDGQIFRVKTTVSVTNSDAKPVRNITATVYLSDDAILDSKDTKLTTLKLTDYFPKFTKLAKGETLSLPVARKVPAAIASLVEGKYLIVTLAGDVTVRTMHGGSTVLNGVLANTASVVFSGSTASSSLLSVSSLVINHSTTLMIAAPGRPLTTITVPAGVPYTGVGGLLNLGQAGYGTITFPVGYTAVPVVDAAGSITSVQLTPVTPSASGTATTVVINPVPVAVATAPPANQVVIGPIHLPVGD